jgi:hypothetical protein
MFNHLEYDAETLLGEYRRDRDAGLGTTLPFNYFPDNDPELATDDLAGAPQLVVRELDQHDLSGDALRPRRAETGRLDMAARRRQGGCRSRLRYALSLNFGFGA